MSPAVKKSNIFWEGIVLRIAQSVKFSPPITQRGSHAPGFRRPLLSQTKSLAVRHSRRGLWAMVSPLGGDPVIGNVVELSEETLQLLG